MRRIDYGIRGDKKKTLTFMITIVDHSINSGGQNSVIEGGQNSVIVSMWDHNTEVTS
jgi:hypothetical protein